MKIRRILRQIYLIQGAGACRQAKTAGPDQGKFLIMEVLEDTRSYRVVVLCAGGELRLKDPRTEQAAEQSSSSWAGPALVPERAIWSQGSQ